MSNYQDLLNEANEIDQKLMHHKSKDIRDKWDDYIYELFSNDLNPNGDERRYLSELSESELGILIEEGNKYLEENS